MLNSRLSDEPAANYGFLLDFIGMARSFVLSTANLADAWNGMGAAVEMTHSM